MPPTTLFGRYPSARSADRPCRCGLATVRLRSIGRDEDSLDRAGETVVLPHREVCHQRGKGIVLDCGSQWNARIHREVPHRTSETETIDQVDGHCHVHGIDRYHLVMNLGVINAA